jgi:peroxiredoxin
MTLTRITISMALVLGSIASARAETSPAPLSLGARAPAATTKIKMKNVDGKMVSIADAAGRAGTLVIFTCNHCPFAKGWEERIAELGNSYAKKGIGVILVNANDPAKNAEDSYGEMQARATKRALRVPYVVDETSEIARAFGATVTPEAFLFDKAGLLAYHGAVDDNHQDSARVQKHYLQDALDAVVAGKPPATSESKSIGCGIKFRKV